MCLETYVLGESECSAAYSIELKTQRNKFWDVFVVLSDIGVLRSHSWKWKLIIMIYNISFKNNNMGVSQHQSSVQEIPGQRDTAKHEACCIECSLSLLLCQVMTGS